jgi:peroxiredoxin
MPWCHGLLLPLLLMASFTTATGQNEIALGVISPGVAEAGGRAPDFLLLDLDQNPVGLAEFRGKPVVLNFFASWCSPCLKELPMIQEAHGSSGDRGFVVLGVGYQDSRWAIEELAEHFGLSFPIVIDGDNSVGQTYRVIGPPYTFFIDADGIIVEVVAGAMDADILRRNLDRLLGHREADGA